MWIRCWTCRIKQSKKEKKNKIRELSKRVRELGPGFVPASDIFFNRFEPLLFYLLIKRNGVSTCAFERSAWSVSRIRSASSCRRSGRDRSGSRDVFCIWINECTSRIFIAPTKYRGIRKGDGCSLTAAWLSSKKKRKQEKEKRFFPRSFAARS